MKGLYDTAPFSELVEREGKAAEKDPVRAAAALFIANALTAVSKNLASTIGTAAILDTLVNGHRENVVGPAAIRAYELMIVTAAQTLQETAKIAGLDPDYPELEIFRRRYEEKHLR